MASRVSGFGKSTQYQGVRALDRSAVSTRLENLMAAPMLSNVLPDLLDEMAALLREAGADPLVGQLATLRIEAVCDCGDQNCSSFATMSEVKVHKAIELPAMEGFLIVDLNAADEICFIEALNRPDLKYLLEEHYLPETK